MKYFVVSEEELRQIYWKKKEPFPRILIDFLKSKQPITKVAEGDIKTMYRDMTSMFVLNVQTSIETNVYGVGLMGDYEGKNIEIYIKESK
jgi:hypothetical protein